ncbi:FecCD family ABC transporter permease [Brenneria tiliae]|uniref:FecCD family ABC transporter permease n=1 Tax=Brenneria tiliae TaxID=2914984 RepID=UPI002015004C|nr:iron chelate uptake ABC transporter family permease subunit [Brenneria tiliae]MCL2897267.1 iron chelate uptake ABC transporter family permease subunit [Brenneria tiliae]MCL2901790.1 iron chelate uptake ABC transporter family permease subunit [Brenneria tiliae]
MTAARQSDAPAGISGAVWRRGRVSLLVSPRTLAVCAGLLLLLLLLAAFAMTAGRIDISVAQILHAILGDGDGGPGDRIIRNIRLPRTLTAIFVGAALGVSGAIFQSVSRNALGSPDIIGCTTGAASGALLQIVLFDPAPTAVAFAAIAGGIAASLLVYLLAVKGGTLRGYRLILTGIGVGSVLSALNGFLLVKGDLDNAVMANLWLAGSVQSRTWMHLIPVMIGVAVLLPVVLLCARKLTMMEMGDDMACLLGIRVERVRLLMILCAVVLAALATGATGPIAFVALAAPQLVTRLTRSRKLPVISAALMGACLLLLADLITLLLPLTVAVPVGRMTGILGGVYLLWLLNRMRRF